MTGEKVCSFMLPVFINGSSIGDFSFCAYQSSIRLLMDVWWLHLDLWWLYKQGKIKSSRRTLKIGYSLTTCLVECDVNSFVGIIGLHFGLQKNYFT